MPRAALRPPLARRRCVAASSSRSREPARGVPSIVPNPSEETDYLRAMPVPFAVVKTIPDEEGRTVDLVFAYVNDAAIALAGCAREVLVGSSVFDACPDVARCMLGVLDDTARTGAAQYFTCRSVFVDRYFSVRSYRPREGFCACVLQDVTEQALLDRRLREERRLLERQAMRDPLTGLYHVRQGRRLVEGALAEPRWEGACSALFMFDVDDFKKVSDEHGHHRGDDVLRGFAPLLEQSFRRTDIVFRAGGDEFSAFVADIPCACVAERICSDVIAGVERLSAEGVPVSVSIGAAVGRPGWSYESYYRVADQALYRIKRTGKSAYRVAVMDGPAAPAPASALSGAPERRSLRRSARKGSPRTQPAA